MLDPRIEKRFQTVEELIYTLYEYRQKLSEPLEPILDKNENYMQMMYNKMDVPDRVEHFMEKNPLGAAGLQLARNLSAVLRPSITMVPVPEKSFTTGDNSQQKFDSQEDYEILHWAE